MSWIVLIAEGGGVRVYAVDAGTLRVDGGGMFGSVPKALWQRQVEPDADNRVPLAMRCLLIVTGGDRILVDTGAGRIEDETMRAVYGLENQGRPTRLEDSLRSIGVESEDIDIVVSTHLHFDHAGGHTLVADGRRQPSFPNARYLVRRGEWEMAQRDNLLIRESYHPVTFESLADSGVLELTDADREISAGVRLVAMPGHTDHHQGVLVDLGDEVVCYPCDLVPTAAHVRLTWIMAYDLDPLTTLAQKERWLTRAGAEGWIIVFAHDPLVAAARAIPGGRGQGCALEGLLMDTDRRSGPAESAEPHRTGTRHV